MKRRSSKGRMSKRHGMKRGGRCGGVANHASVVGGMRRRSSVMKSYRKRIKNSKCRGLKTAKCRSAKSCKMAFGKKRSYCRKMKNTKRM
jgi:hypothetical protein